MSHTPPSQLAGPVLPLQGLRHSHLSGASCWAKVSCGKGLGWFKMMVVMMIMIKMSAAYLNTNIYGKGTVVYGIPFPQTTAGESWTSSLNGGNAGLSYKPHEKIGFSSAMFAYKRPVLPPVWLILSSPAKSSSSSPSRCVKNKHNVIIHARKQLHRQETPKPMHHIQAKVAVEQ